MVDSIGSNLPSSVQAVNKARSNAQAQKAERSEGASAADEVSISSEAQELAEADRLASETRDLLVQNQNETLGRGENLNELL